MTSFTYLGANIDNNSKSEKEVRIRIAKVSSALAKLKHTEVEEHQHAKKTQTDEGRRSSDLAESMRELDTQREMSKAWLHSR